MIPTPVKVVCGLGIAGSVGVTSYFVVSNILKPDKIGMKVQPSEQLIKDGFTLLNFESNSDNQPELTTILSKYKASCKKLTEGKDFFEAHNKARRWCVVPKGIKDSLVEKGKVVINNEEAKTWWFRKVKKKIFSYNGRDFVLGGVVWPQIGKS